jgi:glycosyltransferase involved in cell wall biosynthesis
MRPRALSNLLDSVKTQQLHPDEIIIVDGSRDELTKEALAKRDDKNLIYYKVEDKDRGLTKQRNFGIKRVGKTVDVVCFLDDDIILKEAYFKNLMATYSEFPEAGGVGGYISNEIEWRKLAPGETVQFSQYESQGWVRGLGLRNTIRKRLGLLSDRPPCMMPKFSNGFSIGYYPPTDKTYEVEHFMGGVSSFRKEVVDTIKFSTYFEGYGLYEDSDYTLRVSRKYKLYVNTAAVLEHHHEEGGRPNKFVYGKMVIRNGWYVWKVRYPKVSFKNRVKWNLIAILLASIRFTNTFTSKKRKEAFTEAMGRFYGLLSLIFNKPKLKNE